MYGNLPIVFGGDFNQLKPVGGDSLLSKKDFHLWREKNNIFLELKTNQRFTDDPIWGELLDDLRINDLKEEHVQIINSRLVNLGTISQKILLMQHTAMPTNVQ